MSIPPRPHQQPSGSPWPYGPPPQPLAHLRRQSKPPRVLPWFTHGGAALAALVVGIAIGGSGEPRTPTEAVAAAQSPAAPSPAATVTRTAEAAPAPTVTRTVTAKPVPPKKPEEPGPAISFAGDGEYLVGTDIAAGTYKTAGADGSFGCYWARLKDASGEFDAIIANNNLEGPGRVTLNKGEYFQTQHCAQWKKTG
jgi:hypothetical protein